MSQEPFSGHDERRRTFHEQALVDNSWEHVVSNDRLLQYVTRWRLEEAIRRLMATTGKPHYVRQRYRRRGRRRGFEGSIMCALGFRNVAATDIGENGVRAARSRDPRLKGQSANAEALPFDDGSFDLSIVQDGLHHLGSPVRGFTEMLRVSRRAALFLEPHDSLVGRLIGTKWERNGGAVNYVFRWSRRLVENVTASYLENEDFMNCSFAFWHHNPLYARLGNALGGGSGAMRTIKAVK